MRRAAAALALWLGCTWAGLALAQQVSLAGVMGGRALVIIDGAPPRALAPGESHLGVRVLSTDRDSADVEIGKRRTTLRLGDAPASVGTPAVASSERRIVLTADGAGHFLTPGSINGRSVQFMVDTGATVVALGLPDAERIGLNYRAGQVINLNTANGPAQGWRLRLGSVRINGIEVYDVDAVVTPQSIPFVLLGNSYLTRFQMNRTNDQLTLERRF